MIELVPATEDHVQPIARNMRAWDMVETGAMGHDPAEALFLGLKASVDCFTALDDGQPVAMLGLVPKNILEGEGCPWMLGTEAIYENPRATVKLSRRMVAQWSDSTPHLSGLVAAGNDRAIRYLRRLGFTVEEEVTVIRGVEFVTFERSRDV